MYYILKNILRLLHPFAPFITEEIWSQFNEKKLLIESSAPEINKDYINKESEENVELIMNTISAIRNIKIDLGISAKKKIDIYCRGEKIKTDAFKINKAHLEYLLNVQNFFTGTDIEKPEKSATCVINNIEIFLPLKGLIDINKELSRLE